MKINILEIIIAILVICFVVYIGFQVMSNVESEFNYFAGFCYDKEGVYNVSIDYRNIKYDGPINCSDESFGLRLDAI